MKYFIRKDMYSKKCIYPAAHYVSPMRRWDGIHWDSKVSHETLTLKNDAPTCRGHFV